MESNTCYNTSCQSYQKWAIGNDVRAILLSNANVSSMVGVDIYPLVAPESVDGEFIVYQRDAYAKHATKMGVFEDVCELSLIAISDNYDSSVMLASAIDNALTGIHTLTDGKRVYMNLITSSESFTDNKYMQKLTYEIK